MKVDRNLGAELGTQGYAIRRIPVDAQPFTTYHDPKTGKEFNRLPADAYSMANYLQKGLAIGPAPAELKAKWKAGEPERQRQYDERIRRFERRFNITPIVQEEQLPPPTIITQPSLFDAVIPQPQKENAVQLKLL